MAGEAPESFKKTFSFAFMRSIRTGVFWLRGANDMEMGFRGSFATEGDAKRFGMVTDEFGTPWMVNCEKPIG